jgi:hypothetical protein
MAKCLARSKRLLPENLVPDKLSLKYQFWGLKYPMLIQNGLALWSTSHCDFLKLILKYKQWNGLALWSTSHYDFLKLILKYKQWRS